VTDATLIVRPEKARAQREAVVEDPTVEPGPGPSTGAAPGPVPPPGPQAPPAKTRYFGSKPLQADRYALDFKKVADEVLAPLAATPGVTLKVSIDIEATAPDGFDDAKVRTVSENASTLRFEQSGFEDA
jgi:hypothetical protein